MASLFSASPTRCLLVLEAAGGQPSYQGKRYPTLCCCGGHPLRHQEYHWITKHQGQCDIRTCSRITHLDDLGLAEGRLKDAPLDAVADAACLEVQAGVRQLDLLRPGLRGVVVRSELGHQLGRVLGSVHRQRLGNDQQRICKLCDGQLLPGSQGGRKVLQVDGQAGLYSASTCVSHAAQPCSSSWVRRLHGVAVTCAIQKVHFYMASTLQWPAGPWTPG